MTEKGEDRHEPLPADTGFGTRTLSINSVWASVRRATSRFDSLESVLVLVTIAVISALVVIRLGPSLLGFQVFGGTDLIAARFPWNNGSTPVRTDNPFVGDTIDSLFPSYLEIHRRLGDGDFPWWSSLSGPGLPLLASPSLGLLTPLTGWLVVFPPSWSLGLVKLLQIVAATGGMFLWLRRIGTARTAGLVAGLLYCGSGFFVSWANWVAQATVAALIPVLFWSVERMVQLRTLTSALPVTATVAFLLFAGFPASAGHALYAAAGYFLVRLIIEWTRSSTTANLRTLVIGIGSIVFGLGLSAWQLLPWTRQISEIDLSYRGNQFFGELPQRSLASTVLPRLFLPSGFPASNVIESYAFLGLGTLLLAAVAVFGGRFRRVRSGVVAVLVAVIVIGGAVVWFQGWWTKWLSGVPVFAQNAPGRIRDVIGFAACGLAGIGLDGILRGDLNRYQNRSRALLTTTLGALAALGFAVTVIRYWSATTNHSATIWDIALGIGPVVLICAAAVLWRRRIALAATLAAAIVLVGVQVIVSVGFFWPTSDPDTFYPRNGLIDAATQHVAHDRSMTLGTFLGSTSGVYDIRNITGHVFQPAAWTDYVKAIDPAAYVPPGRTSTNPLLGLDLASAMMRNPLLDRMSARWVITNPHYTVPGDARQLDGSAVAVNQPAAPGGTRLMPGKGLTLPISRQNIRAVQLMLAEKPAGSGPITLTATVSGPSGNAAAAGAISRTSLTPGWVTIPVAGEDLATDGSPLAVTVTVSGGPAAGAGLALAGAGGTAQMRVLTPRDDTLRLTYADEHGMLWERTTALPRIRWAANSTVIGDPHAGLVALSDPATPTDTVILDHTGSTTDGKPATVAIVTDTGDRIVADVTADGAGYLVVADHLDSGWRAWVDGAPATIETADHAFGGVAVPAGTHRIELRYVATGLSTGILISGVSLLIVLGILIVTFVVSRRARRGLATAVAPPIAS